MNTTLCATATTASSTLHSDQPTSEIPNNRFIVLSVEVDKCFGHEEKSLHLTGLPVASNTHTHTRAHTHTHTHIYIQLHCLAHHNLQH